MEVHRGIEDEVGLCAVSEFIDDGAGTLVRLRVYDDDTDVLHVTFNDNRGIDDYFALRRNDSRHVEFAEMILGWFATGKLNRVPPRKVKESGGRKPFDPLSCLPPSRIVREKLEETELKAKRLRILLETVEAVEGEKVLSQDDLLSMRPSIALKTLSVRSRNICDRFSTLRDLISMTEKEFLDQKNCGGTALEEVKSKLSSIGLCFAEKASPPSQSGEPHSPTR